MPGDLSDVPVIPGGLRIGIRCRVVVTVESIRAAGGNDLLGLRADVIDAADAPVLSAYTTLVARGTAEAS